METPQAITENGIIALTLLTCATPFLIAALVMLWLGASRWPRPMRTWWEGLPERARTILRRVQPIAWLLVGIFVGSSLVNPVARWLRMLLP